MKIRIPEICRRALSRRRPATILNPFADPVYEVAPGKPLRNTPASSRPEKLLQESESRWQANRLRKEHSFLNAPGKPAQHRKHRSGPET